MSDCGVCISGCEGEGSIGYRCVIVRAGQEWECSECGGKIPKRTLYELASGFIAEDGNEHWNTKTCLICAEIAEVFMCGGRWHGATLWDGMEGVYEKLTTVCFDRLKTPEAKAELRRRWMEWKGLA